MSQRRIKVLQLQNYYNVNASDLAEQIIQALPTDRYEVTTAFLRRRPGSGEPVSKAERSIYFGYSKSAVSGLRLRALWSLYKHCRVRLGPAFVGAARGAEMRPQPGGVQRPLQPAAALGRCDSKNES